MINFLYVIIQALLSKIRLRSNKKLSLTKKKLTIALLFQHDKDIINDFSQGIIRWETVAHFLTRLDKPSVQVTAFSGAPDEIFDAFIAWLVKLGAVQPEIESKCKTKRKRRRTRGLPQQFQ